MLLRGWLRTSGKYGAVDFPVDSIGSDGKKRTRRFIFLPRTRDVLPELALRLRKRGRKRFLKLNDGVAVIRIGTPKG